MTIHDSYPTWLQRSPASMSRFVQNKAPKVTASDMSPAEWPAQPDHEWCPPGHGDLYPAMLGRAVLGGGLEKNGEKLEFVAKSRGLTCIMW